MSKYSTLLGDVESGIDNRDYSFEFAEQQVRLGFIRKVFGLLTLQLAITVAVSAVFILSPAANLYVRHNPWTFWVAFGVSLSLILGLSCSETARRRHPYNLIMLFTFTVCEAFLIGTVTAMYDTDVVLLAAAITTGVTLALSLYAMQTKYDFTTSGGVLMGVLMALIFASILSLFWHTKVLNIVISAVGAILFSCYLVFDIQLMMGGHKYQISTDEYVFGALQLYLDVINLFLYILQLLNSSRD